MTVTANIHEAKTTLSKLIERALAGEEVVIAKAGKPLVRLIPITEPASVDRGAIFGSMKGRIIQSADWEDSIFDPELEREFYGVDAPSLPHAAESSKPFKR